MHIWLFFCFVLFFVFFQNMDPTQEAASQIIKGGTVTALTVSNKFLPCYDWTNQ